MRASTNPKAARLFPLDVLKAASIAAVVSFHSVFVPQSTYEPVAHLIDVLFAPLRFCVPVLLSISFFLLQRGLEKLTDEPKCLFLKKRLIRLITPIAFWFILAASTHIINHATLAKITIMMFQGNVFNGAYYLLIMLQLLPIFVWSNKWFSNQKNLLIILLFQALIFLLTYATLFGIFGNYSILVLRRIGRPLFIYYFVYMLLGTYLYNNWSRVMNISSYISLRLKIFLLSLTSLTMGIEYSYLHSVTGEKLSPFEYVMFSCILSVVVGFLCVSDLKENQLYLPLRKLVQLLSKYSLGIFCINGIFSYSSTPLSSYIFKEVTFSFPEILVIKLIGWAILLTLSLGLSILLDRLGLGACVR